MLQRQGYTPAPSGSGHSVGPAGLAGGEQGQGSGRDFGLPAERGAGTTGQGRTMVKPWRCLLVSATIVPGFPALAPAAWDQRPVRTLQRATCAAAVSRTR
jgi:hypothetical protein